MWQCLTCGEESENNFDVCWNCQTPKGEFSAENRLAAQQASAESADSKGGTPYGGALDDVGQQLEFAVDRSLQRYEYRMVQIPPSITVKHASGNEAAIYLQSIVNEQASQGWEFIRVDTIGINVPPGCLAGLFGGQSTTQQYYVVTFRRDVQLS